MKNKLLSFILATALLLGSVCGLTSCSNDDDTGAAVDLRSYVTLSMWLIWEEHDPTDESALEIEEAVETAINQITMETFSTKIDITWFAGEEEYKKAVEDRFEKVSGGSTVVLPDETDTPTVEKESTAGDSDELEYPQLKENQLDLVLMLDKDMYFNYAQDGKLLSLDTLLATTYKNLKNDLYQILRYAKAPKDGVYSTYAVPNLNDVGEYTYLLVNKEAAETFQFRPNDLTTLAGCIPLIEEIYNAKESDEVSDSIKNMAPILSYFDYYNSYFYTAYQDRAVIGTDGVTGEPIKQTSEFTLTPTGTNGLYATLWSATQNLGSVNDASVVNTLENSNYVSYLALMNWAKEVNAFALDSEAAEENHTFGVGILKGDYNLRNEYDDYYCVVLDNPRITDEELFHGMWAIPSDSEYSSRAMEIISAIETDQKLLNTLVYGVENENYTYNNQTGCVTSNGTYYVNPTYCGNLFNVYPDTRLGQDSEWFSGLSVQKIEWVRDLWVDFGYVIGTFYDADILVQNDCTHYGVTLRHCHICGEEASIVIDAPTGHVDYGEDGFCDVCSKCVEHKVDETKLGVCTICGGHVCYDLASEDGTLDDFGNPVPDNVCDDETCGKYIKCPHDYEDVKVIHEVTCGANGVKEQKCSVCDNVRYMVTERAKGHVDENNDGVCDVCFVTIPEKHDHKDYYNEYSVLHLSKRYLDLMQNASDEIFDRLFAEKVDGRELTAYVRDFKTLVDSIRQEYFFDEQGNPTELSKAFTYMIVSYDIVTGKTYEGRLGGNLRIWYEKVLERIK